MADERYVRHIAAAAMLFGALSVLASILIQDETYDEPWHLAWSRRLWDEGETERRSDLLYNSKAPISVVNVAAEKLARAAGVEDGRHLLVAARLPGLAFYAAVVGLTFVLGRRLAGEWAGLAAAAAVALEPSIVANASVATVDVPFAAATLLVLVTAMRYAEAPHPLRGAALGVSIGLAFISKYTALLLVPIVLLALGSALRKRRFVLAAGDALACGVVAIALVDAAYLGKGLLRPWHDLGFRSELMRGLSAAMPGLRLPLPADFLTGFDIVHDQDRTHPWDVNLFGPGRGPGVFYYFAACWAMKTPLALLAATLAGLARLTRARPSPGLFSVAAAFLFLLGMVSFGLRAQIGYRLGLMAVPLGLALAAAGWSGAPEPLRRRGLLLVAILAALESAPYLGNSLAFTNGFVLPKRDAFHYLAGANLDWGQNDLKVHAWMRRVGLPPSALEPPYLQPGDNVFSVNSLAGIASPRRLRWARQRLEPREHFRHTYLWLHLDPAEYEQYLDEDRSLPEDTTGDCAGPPRIEFGSGEWTLPPDRNVSWLLCVESSTRGDFTIEGRRGGALLGQESLERRDWERLRSDEPLRYRVGPGTRTLLVFARGKLELRLGFPPGSKVAGRVRAARWVERQANAPPRP